MAAERPQARIPALAGTAALLHDVGAARAVAWHCPEDVAEVANVVGRTIDVGLGAEGLNLVVAPGSCQRLGVDYAAVGRVCLQTGA